MKPARQRKCKNCGEPYTPWSTTQKACSPRCAQSIAQKAAERRRKRETREARQRLKTKSDHIKDCQRAFNRYIRARDRLRGLPCISCGDPLVKQKRGGMADCSHYRSVGAAPHLRFNTKNAALSCVKCNRWLSGNAVEYRVGLINRIGVEAVEALESDNTVKRFDVEYLQRLKKVFNRRAAIRERMYNARYAG